MPEASGTGPKRPDAVSVQPFPTNIQRTGKFAEPSQHRFINRVDHLLDALVSLGPVAATLTGYGLLLDHVPDAWFSNHSIRYLFCGVCALLLGIALRMTARQLLERRTYSNSKHLTISGQDSISSIFAGTREQLLEDVRSAEQDGEQLSGWSQYFTESVPPTAIGTSYGMRLVNALDIYDSRVDRTKLLESLLALQKPGGGWAASSQRDIARPEVTSWVLTVAARAGLKGSIKGELVSKLEFMLDPATDSVGMNSVSVVSTVIIALTELAPSSPKLSEMVAKLMQGAQCNEQDSTVAWGATFSSKAQRSVPHTSRALIALSRVAAAATPNVGDIEDIIFSARRWLCSPSDLNEFAKRLKNSEEQIRRPVRAGQADVLIIGHFTASWVSRALLATAADDTDPFVRCSINMVRQQQKKGIWKWDDTKPIWMTYQGAVALKEYSLRCLGWPP